MMFTLLVRQELRGLELHDCEQINDLEDAGGVEEHEDDEPQHLIALRTMPERQTLPHQTPHYDNNQ